MLNKNKLKAYKMNGNKNEKREKRKTEKKINTLIVSAKNRIQFLSWCSNITLRVPVAVVYLP